MKAMKKVIVISIMSLIFLATYAQRPSKSRSTEVNDPDRKKSEMTTEWSTNNTSRSVEMKSDRTGDVNSNRTTENRSDNVNSNRSITDKINNSKTDLHKNLGPRQRVHPEAHDVYRPRPVEYRRIHHPYRAPVNIHVIWTPRMYYDYRMIYPENRYWYYPNGYRIRTISAYDAIYYTGEIVNVYGRVYEAWYSWETDEYFLCFGAQYPYQDFSVIIPGHRARQFSRRPEVFFEGRYIWVTGLISLHQGQPEMIVRKKQQIHLY